jgi:hypothetical protein
MAATLAALTAAGTGVALAVGAGSPAFASSPNPFPAHVFAPYVDAGLSNTTLTTVANNYGTKFFTLAFADGANCQWSLLNQSGWQSQIDSLRAQGGDVIISFGGWTSDTNGTDLGNTCSSASAAAAQIESVVTTFNVTHLDFDIESNAITNATDVNRTTQALAQVRSWASSSGRQLSLSLTIPSFPSGLGQDCLNLLNTGRANGFIPDVVNIMTMDYGSSGTEMGDAANQALDAVAGQVASVYGISTSAAYAKLGNTPMIGQNDTAGEIFTLADASTVESHAAAEGIALLSFWAEGRDNGGCPGLTTASSSCSGISQNTGDFTRAFQPFSGGTTQTTTTTTAPTTTTTTQSGSCSAPAWDSATAYTGGQSVSYNGHTWTAKWWTQGDVPGNNSQNVWTDNGACSGGTTTTTTTAPATTTTTTTAVTTTTTSSGSSGSLANGNLESGLSPWTCQPGGGVVTSPVHSGSHALQAAATSSQTGECDQTLTLTPNHSYTLTGWVQGNYAYLGVSGGATASTWTASSPGWTQLSVPFTTDSTGSVTVYLHGWYGSGNVYGDDFAVS